MLKLVHVSAAQITLTTTRQTLRRVTAVRPCWVQFVIDGYGIDPTGKKIEFKVYRGTSTGTPGSALTFVEEHTDNNEVAASIATMLDTFGVASTPVAANLVDLFTVHPQSRGASEWRYLLKDETLDFDAIVDTTGSSTNINIKVKVQG